MVLVGSAGVSLTLFALRMPALVDACRRLQGVLGTPAVHFSQAILAHSAPRLAVLPMEGVYWSDWGDPRRLLLDLARFGHQVPALREQGAARYTTTG